MLHLSAERLAELGDTPPTAGEELHLAGCAECLAERDAYRMLVGMAGAEREAMGLPLTRWESIAAELSLAPVDAGPDTAPPRTARRTLSRTSWRPMQVAAGLLLCAGGAMLGRLSAGVSPLPDRVAVMPAAVPAVATAARLAPDTGTFASVAEARTAQERSQQLYEQAAAFLAQHDTSAGAGSPAAYRSRLAALDQVISTTREALREAPHDPVINDYYLTTIGQREATLRQLNTALPASLRLNSF